ncbi:hypothetical protein TB2_008317 [Malus domestica]
MLSSALYFFLHTKPVRLLQSAAFLLLGFKLYDPIFPFFSSIRGDGIFTFGFQLETRRLCNSTPLQLGVSASFTIRGVSATRRLRSRPTPTVGMADV